MTRRVSPYLLATVAALAALVGCGKSDEQIALDRIANRKDPGLVRLYNLTDVPIGLLWTTMQWDSDIKPGTVSVFRRVGEGKQEITITSAGGDLGKVSLKVDSEATYTVVVFGTAAGIETAVVRDEQEKPSATKNLQAFFIDQSGKSFTGEVEVSSGSDTYRLTNTSGGVLARAGNYEVKGSGLATATGSTIEADGAYSVLVVRAGDGKTHAILARNTSTDKPSAGGLQ